VLTRPQAVTDEVLSAALSGGWHLTARRIEYRPVGFGSHHWSVVDDGGCEWFVTIDDLDAKLHSAHETTDTAFARLRSALSSARAAHEAGATFVVAPVPTQTGEVVRRLAGRFAVALYPYVEGASANGEYESVRDRLAVLELIAALHRLSPAVSGGAGVDDFALANRDELERALDDLEAPWDRGPYSEASRAVL
jgi:hypothetical protein